MNKNELLEVLNTLKDRKENVILIDGKWGSGKTHLINEYIKQNKNENIYYVSLLGKRNIDDINTALFVEVNRDITITNTVPSSVSPFSKHSSLDHILKLTNFTNNIVILDDLERYGSSHYDEFLSYVQSLILKGCKVIIVSNLDYLGSGERYNFELYKEKMFDRVFKTNLFSQSILEAKLHEYYKDIDDIIYPLFNDNIRMIDKLYDFLTDLKPFYKEKIHNKSFITYCLVFLTTIFNEIKLSYPKITNKAKEEAKNYIFSHTINEEDGWECLKIYEFSLNLDCEYLFVDSYELITSLYNIYYYLKDFS